MLDEKKVDLLTTGISVMTFFTKGEDSGMEYDDLHLLAARFVKEIGVSIVSMSDGYDEETKESSVIVLYKDYEGTDSYLHQTVRKQVDAWIGKFEKQKGQTDEIQ